MMKTILAAALLSFSTFVNADPVPMANVGVGFTPTTTVPEYSASCGGTPGVYTTSTAPQIPTPLEAGRLGLDVSNLLTEGANYCIVTVHKGTEAASTPVELLIDVVNGLVEVPGYVAPLTPPESMGIIYMPFVLQGQVGG